MQVTKAIIPTAGYGTRRLPVSKVIEKCMMPVINRPIVDYIVQDCIKAGITEFYFVVNKGASQIRSFYSPDPALETYLKNHGKEDLIPNITPPAGITFKFIEQDINQDYGTTTPLWLCRQFINPDQSFLVIMGDQFFYNPDGQSEAANFLARLSAAGATAGMLATEVPPEEVSRYGIVKTAFQNGREIYQEIIEKPAPQDAPSNLNNASFYLFDSKIIPFVEQGMSNFHNGEHMITDVLNNYAAAGNPVAVVRARGQYLDCGNNSGWLKANEALSKTADS